MRYIIYEQMEDSIRGVSAVWPVMTHVYIMMSVSFVLYAY